jgi:hypothetical protein
MPPVETEYPWYKIIEDNSVCQGDLLFNFEVIEPQWSEQADQVPAIAKTLDVVVMTQTCDIIYNKIESILLCSCWDFWVWVAEAKREGKNWSKERRESLRQGNIPGYYLCNEADQDSIKMGIKIVDFHEVYTSPIKSVKAFATKNEKRLRLLPPYREHMSQAFARFFMRVGLPVDIPEDKLKKEPSCFRLFKWIKAI